MPAVFALNVKPNAGALVQWQDQRAAWWPTLLTPWRTGTETHLGMARLHQALPDGKLHDFIVFVLHVQVPAIVLDPVGLGHLEDRGVHHKGGGRSSWREEGSDQDNCQHTWESEWAVAVIPLLVRRPQTALPAQPPERPPSPAVPWGPSGAWGEVSSRVLQLFTRPKVILAFRMWNKGISVGRRKEELRSWAHRHL